MAIKSDGSVIIDTLVDTKGFNRGVGNMQKSVSGLTASIGRIGAAIGAAFGVSALVSFGRSAIDLGSDLSEVQNVVDVTFGAMADSINKFANDAIEQFGLSEISAKRYASTMGAMLKSMGMQTSKALEMGKTLTGLAGDLASFYNLSSDEAFAKIRAGISGETEPLKQLGINLSVANLEAFALAEGITKSYNAMSEQEKVMLRYKYLLKTTADAQGDFARTSDGWANQVRILTEKFNSLKATIGQGLINVFTPLIKRLNTVLEKMQAVANAFKALTEQLFGKQEAQKAKENLSVIEEEYNSVADATNNAKKAQDSYLTGLDEINTFKTSDDGVSADISGGLLDAEVTADGNAELENTEEIIANLEKRFPKLIAFLEETGAKLKEIGQDFKLGDFGELGADITDLTVAIYDYISSAIEDVNWKEIGNEIGNFLERIEWLEILKSALSLGQDASDALADLWFGSLEEAPFETIVGTFLAGLVITGNLNITLLPILAWQGGFSFGKELGKLIDKDAQEFYDNFTWSGEGGFIDTIKNTDFENILDAWDDMYTDIVNNPLYRFLTNTWVLPKHKSSDDLKAEWEQLVDDLKVIGEGIVTFGEDYIVKPFKMWGEDIADWWHEDVTPWFTKDKWVEAMKGIKDAFNTTWKGAVNVAIELLNKFIDFINEKMHFEWDAFKVLGKELIPAGNVQLFTIPNIPYLATGAVIPPNAPFMAMLGDQKHGNNIETPESLLRKVVREESGNGGSKTIHNVVQINRRTLLEEMVAEAKLQQSTTGRNPFELA